MLIELLKLGRFILDALPGRSLGPRRSRKRLHRTFLLKAVYNFPATNMLVENLCTPPRLYRLYGWDFACVSLSRATFCHAFGEFAESGLGGRLHEAMVAESYTDKIVGQAILDSTESDGRERASRRKAPSPPPKGSAAPPHTRRRKRRRRLPRTPPGTSNSSRTTLLRRILRISPRDATGAGGATARGRRRTGWATSSISRSRPRRAPRRCTTARRPFPSCR